MDMGVKVNTPYHFVTERTKVNLQTSARVGFYRNFIPGVVNKFIELSFTIFPKAPGTIIGAFILLFQNEDP
jgi:hypothetical protein